jgi:riboflavin synthase
MFTGIVEEAGRVAAIHASGSGARLEIAAPLVGSDAALGDSICINGVCLTVTARTGDGASTRLSFDAVPETLRRSTLGELRPGDVVNLERSLAAGARLGGHIVQGHVDAVGRISALRPEGNATLVTVASPPEVMRYVVEKGSIALDGISLTVAACTDADFTVSIIPHTWQVTNLSRRRIGDRVNLEVDILAKYVERLLAGRLGAPSAAGVSEEMLREHGFA